MKKYSKYLNIEKSLLVYVYEFVSLILTFISLLVHGFHTVIVTRSYERSEKMPVLQEFRDYFSELIQPLATKVCLDQLFQKLKEEIITKFEKKKKKCIEQNRKI